MTGEWCSINDCAATTRVKKFTMDVLRNAYKVCWKGSYKNEGLRVITKDIKSQLETNFLGC